MSVLHWSTSFDYKFLLKVDDDVLLNPEKIHQIIHQVVPSTLYKEKLVLGFPVNNATVHRHGKYKVEFKDYSQSQYPQFLLGSFYILTASAVEAFVKEGLKDVKISLEDVAITGVLRKRLNIVLLSLKRYMVPSLEYVTELIKFFRGDIENCVEHLREYGIVHMQFEDDKDNKSNAEIEKVSEWIWRKVWKHREK